MPEDDKTYATDKIANAQDNPSQSITCNQGNIGIKNNGADFTLNLANGSDKSVIMLRANNMLEFGVLSQVLRTVIDGLGNQTVKTAVICQSDKISIQVGDVGYDIKLPVAEDGSVMVKKGNDITLSTLDRLRFKTVAGNETTINSSVQCKTDTITLQVGTISFDLKFKAVDMKGTPLIGKSGLLTFDQLPLLANVVTTVEGNVTTTTVKSSIECTEESFKLKIGDTNLDWKLDGGGENSPIIKSGNNLIFGDPPSASAANVVISDVLPTIDQAAENTVYFIYDSQSPITP